MFVVSSCEALAQANQCGLREFNQCGSAHSNMQQVELVIAPTHRVHTLQTDAQ
jgi:hypothetical protein